MFMAEESGSDAYTRGDIDSIQFVKGKRLDMDLVLKKFAEYFNDIYGDFHEKPNLFFNHLSRSRFSCLSMSGTVFVIK